MAEPLRREDYDHRASYASWQDDLLYESAPRLAYDGNLARAPEYPVRKAPITRPIPRRKTVAVPSHLTHTAKAIIIMSIIAICAALLFITVDSGRVYTARQELDAMEEQLDNARTTTAVLEHEQTSDMSLSELYNYAVTALGMQEATKDDITYIESLAEQSTTVTEDEPTAHEPTRISFHLFG